MAKQLHDLEVHLHHETKVGEEDEGAILVSLDGDRRNAVWLPKVAVEIDRLSHPLVITAPVSLLTEKGLV